MTTTQLKAKLFVYVIIATEDAKVKECKVIHDHAEANTVWAELVEIYGGGNVCFVSRSVSVPMESGSN